ncbi:MULTISPECIES: hypothetical protein [Flavobacterium]|uniref:hypothetical protein n=1 Tax=Flavobacterium TaxID=237 RepID=UPI001FCA7F77|nr:MULTISPECIES: hypothetical protein [Flavobacterium]UOK42156.1 hypothetical protein LZF87_12660 [Flavobacterium enshiense]
MTTTQKISRLFVLSLFPLVGIFFLYHQYERPNIKSIDDITFIEGRIKDYSFKYKGGGRAISRQFYIWVQGYDCKFQIAADYLPYFQKTRFEQNLVIGDSIKIGIPNNEKEKLYEDETILSMSIDSKYGNYLSSSDIIKEENKYFDIYAGLIFLGLGYGLYLLQKKWPFFI